MGPHAGNLCIKRVQLRSSTPLVPRRVCRLRFGTRELLVPQLNGALTWTSGKGDPLKFHVAARDLADEPHVFVELMQGAAIVGVGSAPICEIQSGVTSICIDTSDPAERGTSVLLTTTFEQLRPLPPQSWGGANLAKHGKVRRRAASLNGPHGDAKGGSASDESAQSQLDGDGSEAAGSEAWTEGDNLSVLTPTVWTTRREGWSGRIQICCVEVHDMRPDAPPYDLHPGGNAGDVYVVLRMGWDQVECPVAGRGGNDPGGLKWPGADCYLGVTEQILDEQLQLEAWRRGRGSNDGGTGG
ncbi:unnamed protein product, partial [Phaeothamnion confervicola]